MAYALGVDIGGTKIAAGLVDEAGDMICRTELPSIPKDREEMFQQVVNCMEKVLSKSQLEPTDLAGIGIGVPGKVDCEKGIAKYQNNLPWADFPLARRIKENFPIEKVVVDNDVFMAAYAEWQSSGGDPNDTFVYVTISTGISCCTIHRGHFIRGTGFAGEIGFLPIGEGQLGREARLEEVASGPGIERKMTEMLNFLTADENAVKVTAKEVFEGFRSENPHTKEIMIDTFNTLAKGLYSVACVLDPDKLILGGGVVNNNPDLLKHLKKALKPYLVSYQLDILNRMQEGKFEKNAGLVGAGLRIIHYGSKELKVGNNGLGEWL